MLKIESKFFHEWIFYTEDFTVLTPFWDFSITTTLSKIFKNFEKNQKQSGAIVYSEVSVCEWSKNYKIQNVEFIDFDVCSRLLVPQEKLNSDISFLKRIRISAPWIEKKWTKRFQKLEKYFPWLSLWVSNSPLTDQMVVVW